MAAAAAMLTGCLKSTDSSSKFSPVAPGLDIYSCAGNQTQVALLPANSAIRLGMLLAEAEKQGKTEELESFAGDGAGQPIDTESAKRWIVTVDDVLQVNPSAREPLNLAGGTTSIYYAGGSYRIEVNGCVGYFVREIQSDWDCVFDWTPADVGRTTQEPPNSEGRYLSSGYIAGGTERARLTSVGDYDTSRYPSPEVSVVWSYEAGRISYVVNYNGNTVSSN